MTINGHWAIFGVALFLICLSIGNLLYYGKTKLNISKERYRKKSIMAIGYGLIYVIDDLFYMSIFLHNKTWQFIFGIVIIISYLLSAGIVLSSDNERKTFGLVVDFCIGIGVTIYLIYIIEDANLQNIITVIIAAIYGGLLTLCGVAWTIKHENKQRNNEEIKRNVPYLTIIQEQCLINSEIKINHFIDYKKLPSETAVNVYKINDIRIKNIANSLIIVEGLIINKDIYKLTNETCLESQASCKISTTYCSYYESVSNLNCMGLLVRDILGNEYCVDCETRVEFGNRGRFVSDDGHARNDITLNINTVNLSLPKRTINAK